MSYNTYMYVCLHKQNATGSKWSPFDCKVKLHPQLLQVSPVSDWTVELPSSRLVISSGCSLGNAPATSWFPKGLSGFRGWMYNWAACDKERVFRKHNWRFNFMSSKWLELLRFVREQVNRLLFVVQITSKLRILTFDVPDFYFDIKFSNVWIY